MVAGTNIDCGAKRQSDRVELGSSVAARSFQPLADHP
jgi:hypothetical protein